MTRNKDTVILRTTVPRDLYEQARTALPDGQTLSGVLRDLLTNYVLLHTEQMVEQEDQPARP